MVGFVVKDFTAPARSFSLGLMVRLSELGTMIDCMQSACTPTSHFRVVAEDVRRELGQLLSLRPQQILGRRPHGIVQTLSAAPITTTAPGPGSPPPTPACRRRPPSTQSMSSWCTCSATSRRRRRLTSSSSALKTTNS